MGHYVQRKLKRDKVAKWVYKKNNNKNKKLKHKYEPSSHLCLLLKLNNLENLKLNNLENWGIFAMLDNRIIGSMNPFSTSDIQL